MDYKIWIDVSKMTPGDWVGVSIAALAVLWVILVVLKLWLSRPRDDAFEPMEMNGPGDPVAVIFDLERQVQELREFIRALDRQSPSGALDMISAKVRHMDAEVEGRDLHLVDLTSGEILGRGKR